MSGLVDTVYVAKCLSDNKITFLKGNVTPSQKLKDDPHKVWICVEGSGSGKVELVILVMAVLIMKNLTYVTLELLLPKVFHRLLAK